jgi:predicted MPP superfamily phosphohydrolase
MVRSPVLLISFFIAVAISILFLSHYFIYFSLVRFFALAGRRKIVLGVILFLLPASFIAGSTLARWMDNPVGRAIYFGSALWLGVGLTLMVAFGVAWAVLGAARLAALRPPLAALGAAATALAVLFSAYGVWNARHPRVHHLTVKIKNLPPAWQGKRIVQISDVHLGHILGPSFMQSLVEQSNAQKSEAVFITGDLFDGADGRLDQLVAPLDGLVAPRGVYFITGNHEVYLGVARAFSALEKTKVKILNDEMLTLDGLEIIGIAYPQRGESKDLAEVAKRLGHDPSRPSILLYHSPAQTERAKAAGISLQLAGHTHYGQIFPFQFVTWRVFGKYYRGLHTEGDYTLYTSSGAGTWGPAMRTGNRPEITVLHLESIPSQ